MLFVLFGIFFILFIIYSVNLNNSNNDTFFKLPGPKYYPIIGNSINFVILSSQALHKWIVYKLPLYGPIIRLGIFGTNIILINGASAAEVILSRKRHITKTNTYKFMEGWLGNGILPTTGHRWRSYRKALNPGFYINNLNSFLPIFNKNSRIFLDCVAKDLERISVTGINIYPYAAKCALDIIFESTTGTTVNAQLSTNSQYFKAIKRNNELLVLKRYRSLLRFDFIWQLSPQKREMDKNSKYVFEYGAQILEQRREYLKHIETEKKKKQNAIIDLLIAEEEKHEECFTRDDIIYNMNNLIPAGFDTISTSISFTLFVLGAYPDIQTNVVEELVQVFGDSGREPDVNDLTKLKLLERCIKESLRLFPPVPYIEKKLEARETFGEYEIPSGFEVAFNIQAIHKDPKYFNDPEKFDPDRFLPENNIGRNPYAFIPFSAGPRNCIGQKYAMMEGKVIISTFLRRYRVESVVSIEEINEELLFQLVLIPIGGIPIKIFERTSHPQLKVSY